MKYSQTKINTQKENGGALGVCGGPKQSILSVVAAAGSGRLLVDGVEQQQQQLLSA